MRTRRTLLLLALLALLSAAPAYAAKATLTWVDNSNNEQGFNIRKAANLTCASAAQLAQVGADVKTYTDNAVVEGGSYSYQVNAYNTAGASAWTNCASITIAWTQPPGPSGAAYGPTSLTWVDNSTNETGFKVQRKAEACAGAGAFSDLATTAANVTSYIDGTTVEGGTYCYQVAATNPSFTSAYSNRAERTVPFTVPAAPSQLDATSTP